MDHSEQTPNQLQQTDDGVTHQIPTAPAFGYTATPVLATSNLRAPVSLPTLLPQISYSHNWVPRYADQRSNDLQQRLRLFWENQRNQVEQTNYFKSNSVPLARIKKIMKADQDVHMIAAETPVLFAKAIEMFIVDLTLRGWTHTEDDRRRTLQKTDIVAAISGTDIFDFLDDVIPEHLKLTNATLPQLGSSAMTNRYVPDQHYPDGPSGYAGGQQPQPHVALPQLKPSINWQQQFAQQNQEQSLILLEPQQNQKSSVPQAPEPQQVQQHNNQQQDDEEE